MSKKNRETRLSVYLVDNLGLKLLGLNLRPSYLGMDGRGKTTVRRHGKRNRWVRKEPPHPLLEKEKTNQRLGGVFVETPYGLLESRPKFWEHMGKKFEAPQKDEPTRKPLSVNKETSSSSTAEPIPRQDILNSET